MCLREWPRIPLVDTWMFQKIERTQSQTTDLKSGLSSTVWAPQATHGLLDKVWCSCQWKLQLACRHDKDIWYRNFCRLAMDHFFRTMCSTCWKTIALSGWNVPKTSRHMLKHHINTKKKANNAILRICIYVLILHYVLAWNSIYFNRNT